MKKIITITSLFISLCACRNHFSENRINEFNRMNDSCGKYVGLANRYQNKYFSTNDEKFNDTAIFYHLKSKSYLDTMNFILHP